MLSALFPRRTDPAIQREFMRAMVARAGSSVTANLVGVAILMSGCFVVSFGRTLALALAFRVVAICITAANTRAMRQRIEHNLPLDSAVDRFALGMAFAGVTWGGLLLSIPADQFNSLSATLVRLVVLTGVVLVTLTAAPVPKVMLAYCGSFVLVAGAHLLSLSGAYGFFPLIVGVLLFVGIMTFGIGMTKEAHDAARTLVENQQMARVLGSLNEELGAALEQADRLARYDQLTGLPNRLSFEEACSSATLGRKSSEKYHLLLLDLDHFKSINDTSGHQGGDLVLQATGKALSESVRGLPAGSIAARIGGEEFAILLPSLDAAGATAFGELLCDRVRHIAPPPGYDHTITTSVGVAAWRKDEPLHLAMKRADEALYRAKSSGRNQAIIADQRAA